MHNMLDTSPARLLQFLEALDITNTRLGYLCGVQPNTVSRWLHGHTPVPHAVIRMLALMQVAEQGTAKCRAMIPGDPGEMDPTDREVEEGGGQT
jgi:hypothetical protein